MISIFVVALTESMGFGENGNESAQTVHART